MALGSMILKHLNEIVHMKNVSCTQGKNQRLPFISIIICDPKKMEIRSHSTNLLYSFGELSIYWYGFINLPLIGSTRFSNSATARRCYSLS